MASITYVSLWMVLIIGASATRIGNQLPTAGVHSRITAAGTGRTLSSSSSSSSSLTSGFDDALQIDSLPRLLSETISLDDLQDEPALYPDQIISGTDSAAGTQTTGTTGTPGITETPGAYGTGIAADPALASSADVVPEVESEDVTADDTVTGGPGSPAVIVTSDDGTTGDQATTGSVSTTEAAVKDPSAAAVRSGDTVNPAYPSDTSSGNQIVEQLDGGQIAGIVLGVAVAAGVIAAAVMGYQRYKRHRADDYISRYSRYNEIEMR